MKCTFCGNIGRAIVNTDYNVPYVAGYSNDGQTIYIDSRLPEMFIDSKKQKVNIYKYLIIHEVTEKSLKDELNYSYNEAHTMAMGAQAQALSIDGINYDEYYGFLQKYVNFDIQVDDFNNVPPDLDISPYVEDHLTEVVNKIKRLQRE